jgi:membrane-bound metal-dependent hydrolase YbcI (DUF457 family)
MQAINHAATALVLKRRFPTAPLLGLILATEAVEYLWVALTVIGVERTVISAPMQSVADVHLVFMPFSHSLATSLFAAAAVAAIVLWRGGRRAIPAALGLATAVASHVALDLLVHAPDVAIAPFTDGDEYGTGLYATFPLAALAIETLWAIVCWWIYRGRWPLLCLIIALELAAVPVYSATLNLGESVLAGRPSLFSVVILIQILATSVLVWAFARKDEANARPDRSRREKSDRTPPTAMPYDTETAVLTPSGFSLGAPPPSIPRAAARS